MKIVEINSVNFGSTGSIMYGIRDTAISNGHQVFTFSAPGLGLKTGIKDHYYIGGLISRHLSYKLAYLTGNSGQYSKNNTKYLIRKLNEIKPDIVHLHNLHSEYINLPLLFEYLKKSRVKVVWTLHDCWAFTGHCPHFDNIQCNKWITGCNECPQFHLYPASKHDNSSKMYELKKEWFTGINDLTIITPSKWLANLVGKSFLKEYDVKVINNGINLNVFKPTSSNFRDVYNCNNKILLLGVSFAWDDTKGLDIFIELAKRLPSIYQIVMVGISVANKTILPDNIIAIDRTSNQIELAKIYTACDIFINPTRQEVFGLVNIEALACGLPVITFNSGGSPETIDETCGIVLNNKTVNDMLVAIEDLRGKSINKKDCIARANLFNEHMKYQEYINVYENKG